MDKNIIFVSSKKNIMFFFNLSKSFLKSNDTILLKACGTAMSTAMIVAEMLKDSNLVSSITYETNTHEQQVLNNTTRRNTQLTVTLSKPQIHTWGSDDENEVVFPERPVTPPTQQVYLSMARPVAFWVSLAQTYLVKGGGSCEVFATGRCISSLMIMYECFRMDKKVSITKPVSCTKLHSIEDKKYKKTQVSFIINILDGETNSDVCSRSSTESSQVDT